MKFTHAPVRWCLFALASLALATPHSLWADNSHRHEAGDVYAQVRGEFGVGGRNHADYAKVYCWIDYDVWILGGVGSGPELRVDVVNDDGKGKASYTARLAGYTVASKTRADDFTASLNHVRTCLTSNRTVRVGPASVKLTGSVEGGIKGSLDLRIGRKGVRCNGDIDTWAKGSASAAVITPGYTASLKSTVSLLKCKFTPDEHLTYTSGSVGGDLAFDLTSIYMKVTVTDGRSSWSEVLANHARKAYSVDLG